MAETVTAVLAKRRIEGNGWSLRADRLELLDGTDWRALIGVRRGLNLLVTWTDQATELEVAAWAGEPEASDGVAVIDAGAGDVRLARVPLCSCGDRGCGNAGIQFAKWLPGNRLPALVELFRDLPWTQLIPTRANVLVGQDLAAIESSPGGGDVGPGSYLYAPGTGAVFPLRPERRD